MSWNGMSIRTVSTVSACENIKIDRCAVRCYRTLYGDIYYIVEGAFKNSFWYPISHEFKNPEKAIDYMEKIESRIKEDKVKNLKGTRLWT